MSAWIPVGDTAEFINRDRKLIELDNAGAIFVLKTQDGFHAVDARCSHEKALLTIGELAGNEIVCPLHGARFDVRTGRNLSLPAVKPIPHYEVKVEGDKVFVKL